MSPGSPGQPSHSQSLTLTPHTGTLTGTHTHRPAPSTCILGLTHTHTHSDKRSHTPIQHLHTDTLTHLFTVTHSDAQVRTRSRVLAFLLTLACSPTRAHTHTDTPAAPTASCTPAGGGAEGPHTIWAGALFSLRGLRIGPWFGWSFLPSSPAPPHPGSWSWSSVSRVASVPSAPGVLSWPGRPSFFDPRPSGAWEPPGPGPPFSPEASALCPLSHRGFLNVLQGYPVRRAWPALSNGGPSLGSSRPTWSERGHFHATLRRQNGCHFSLLNKTLYKDSWTQHTT